MVLDIAGARARTRHAVAASSLIAAAVTYPLIVLGGIKCATSLALAQETTTPLVNKPTPAAPSNVNETRFDDWTLRCTVKPDSTDDAPASSQCEIFQPLMVGQDGKPVEILSLAISRVPDQPGRQKWMLVVLTPLDVSLASDLGLGIGSVVPVIVRYRNCNHLGCFVTIPLNDERIVQMKRAAEGAVFLRLLNGQLVRVSFSLSGFTKAFEALAAGDVPAAMTGSASGETSDSSGEGAKQ